MAFIPRSLAPRLVKAARAFPALILTGPRRAGKTTLLRRLFPQASYRLIEDPDVIARLRADPRAFLEDLKTPAILDEIQHVPEVLNYVRSLIDRDPRKKGRWLLTGSQEAPLMRGVSESMAGRAAIFQLLPLSLEETSKVSLLRGGFPEVVTRPAIADTWYQSYLQTYLERDVRAVSSIRDLSTFRRFMALLASRCGHVLNRSEFAAPLGVSVPTISEWLGILEVTAQILLVQPFYENFGKRLIKSPKLYFVDSGLVCHLLHIESESALNTSPFLGPLFEGYVASEIVKTQVHAGRRRELYYFRDQQGLEVDFVIPARHHRLLLCEAKASTTVSPSMADSLSRLLPRVTRYQAEGYLVHRPSTTAPPLRALRPGVQAIPIDALPSLLSRR